MKKTGAGQLGPRIFTCRPWQDAQAVFQEADADDSGAITFAEFTGHLEDLRVQAFLRSTMAFNTI